MTYNKWTAEWPEEEGWFWFYGDPFGARYVRPESVRAYAVRIMKATMGFIRVCEGHFLYRGEASPGLWLRMVTPIDPNKENTSE